MMLKDLQEQKDVRLIRRLRSEFSEHPILGIGRGRNAVAVMHPGIGGAMAAAGLEQIIALGARSVIAGAGEQFDRPNTGTYLSDTFERANQPKDWDAKMRILI